MISISNTIYEVLTLNSYFVAKFIVPEWGDKVESGIGLSYRPVSLCNLAGRYRLPNAGVNYIS
jgi:hypothetical protein